MAVFQPIKYPATLKSIVYEGESIQIFFPMTAQVILWKDCRDRQYLNVHLQNKAIIKNNEIGSKREIEKSSFLKEIIGFSLLPTGWQKYNGKNNRKSVANSDKTLNVAQLNILLKDNSNQTENNARFFVLLMDIYNN